MGGQEKRVTLNPPGSSVAVGVRESQVRRYEAQGWTRAEAKPTARRRSNVKKKQEGEDA